MQQLVIVEDQSHCHQTFIHSLNPSLTLQAPTFVNYASNEGSQSWQSLSMQNVFLVTNLKQSD